MRGRAAGFDGALELPQGHGSEHCCYAGCQQHRHPKAQPARNPIRAFDLSTWRVFVDLNPCERDICRKLPDIDAGKYLPLQTVCRVDQPSFLSLRHCLLCTLFRCRRRSSNRSCSAGSVGAPSGSSAQSCRRLRRQRTILRSICTGSRRLPHGDQRRAQSRSRGAPLVPQTRRFCVNP